MVSASCTGLGPLSRSATLPCRARLSSSRSRRRRRGTPRSGRPEPPRQRHQPTAHSRSGPPLGAPGLPGTGSPVGPGHTDLPPPAEPHGPLVPSERGVSAWDPSQDRPPGALRKRAPEGGLRGALGSGQAPEPSLARPRMSIARQGTGSPQHTWQDRTAGPRGRRPGDGRKPQEERPRRTRPRASTASQPLRAGARRAAPPPRRESLGPVAGVGHACLRRRRPPGLAGRRLDGPVGLGVGPSGAGTEGWRGTDPPPRGPRCELLPSC